MNLVEKARNDNLRADNVRMLATQYGVDVDVHSARSVRVTVDAVRDEMISAEVAETVASIIDEMLARHALRLSAIQEKSELAE